MTALRLRAVFTIIIERDNEETIGDVLNAMGIPTRFIVQRRQPLWAKLSKEILRGLLLFNADWRKRAV